MENIDERFIMHIQPDDTSVAADLASLINISGFLKTDLELQAKNLELSGSIIDESNVYIEGEFRSLVEQMVNISREDLSDLITLYQQLNLDQTNMLKNLEYIQNGLSDSFDALDVHGEQLNEKLKKSANLTALRNFLSPRKLNAKNCIEKLKQREMI